MVRNLSAVSIADSTMQPLVRRTIQRALPEWCDDLRAWQRPAAARAGTEVRSLTQWNAPFRLIGLPVLPQSAHERNPSLQRRERARRPVPSGSATTCPRPGGPALLPAAVVCYYDKEAAERPTPAHLGKTCQENALGSAEGRKTRPCRAGPVCGAEGQI
jgi:hypothetical protein